MAYAGEADEPMCEFWSHSRYGAADTCTVMASAAHVFGKQIHWARRPSPRTTTSGGSTYVVQRGDTLASIAARFGTTYQAIAAANGIANPNLIYVGQTLQINGGGTTPPPTSGGGTTPLPNNAPLTGFELGGHVVQANYPFSDAMRQSGMTWAKRQIRWTRGTPASNFQGEIDADEESWFPRFVECCW